MDFDAKQFVPMILRMVLSSISQNFRYALDGAIAALAVMLVFHGEGKFFHRLWSLQFALAVTLVVGCVVRRGISEVVARVDDTPIAEPTTGAVPEEEEIGAEASVGSASSGKKKAIGARSTEKSKAARSNLD